MSLVTFLEKIGELLPLLLDLVRLGSKYAAQVVWTDYKYLFPYERVCSIVTHSLTHSPFFVIIRYQDRYRRLCLIFYIF